MQPKRPRINPLILALALAAVLMVWSVMGSGSGSTSGSTMSYSTVVHYFEHNQVTAFTLDRNTSVITLNLKEGDLPLPDVSSTQSTTQATGGLLSGMFSASSESTGAVQEDDGTVTVRYKLPYAYVFIENVEKYIESYDAANPDAPMTYDYTSLKETIPWMEIIFYLGMLGCTGFLLFSMMLGRSAALTLAAVVAAPFPAVQTALWWGQRNLQSETSDPEPEPAAEEQAPPASSAVPEAVQALTGGIEDYLVALQPEDARPADAGAVIEKQYPQGSGEKYIACGAGSIKNNTRQTAADIAAEIENPLPFAIEPNSPDPQVLVMHTHATEDYRLSAGLWFAPGDGARSTDCSVNMCAVGRVVADTLNAAGINTLHDETLNDYPSYTGSYANSRAVVQQYLARYPSIKVVLDVHRDAIETESGSRYAPVCMVDGRQAAQVMIICGCDNGTTVQLPGWRQNLRFAAAWERSMEGMYPGFTRPVLFSYRFYNQDLTTGSLLIEIGGHGNNLNEALYAGQLAAKGLAAALLGGA